MANGLEAKAAAGEIVADPHQHVIAEQLDGIIATLDHRDAERSFLDRLFARKMPGARGLYLHGHVGRGKTMLMDMFHERVPIADKRRIHFDGFMSDVHDRVHAVREAERLGRRAKGDPIAPVSAAIAAETRLLCVDEFAVTDIADAMVLSRLFSGLFERGLVLVATSNSAPTALYRNGLNRDLFLPFVDLLNRHVDVAHLDGGLDYRLRMLSGQPIYLSPADDNAADALDRLWRNLTRGEAEGPTSLKFKGRSLIVPHAACGAARFTFAQLCEAPLGTADYLAIARTFHTVFVDGIPVIVRERREIARRFVLLIDALYDRRTKLVASAAVEPAALYKGSGDLKVAFRRTVSRLVEMQSHSYLAASHGRSADIDPA